MTKKQIEFLFQVLNEKFYSDKTELNYSTSFQLLVAVILSAQCTDKRVNLITPKLWEIYGDAYKMSKATQDDIFQYIKICSYPNNKAKNLLMMSKKLIDDFGNIIPDSLSKLQTLAGVGLKTAKVVVHVLYGKDVIAVDTHVFRVVNRLGLVHEKNYNKVSELLEKIIPNKYKGIAHHSMIYFGRYHCLARKPKCSNCPFNVFCEYYLKKNK